MTPLAGLSWKELVLAGLPAWPAKEVVKTPLKPASYDQLNPDNKVSRALIIYYYLMNNCLLKQNNRCVWEKYEFVLKL